MDLRQETIAGRRARYTAVRDRFIEGLEPLGIRPILPSSLQSPICVAFRSDLLVPDADAFADYYRHLRDAGLLIYARFHRESRSFRIGCIGRIEPAWIDDLIDATWRFTRLNSRPDVVLVRRHSPVAEQLA